MKFSCEKALLSAAVSVTSRAVAVKSSIAAMEGILLECGDQLKLTGYNLETGIQATVPAEIKETGSLVLSARLFGEIVRKMPDDMVNLSINGQSQVPPGFRFHPTEEELLHYYLRKKVAYERIDLDVIREVDLNKLEPWDIQGKLS